MAAPAGATVFFCHGSRSPAWREPFERLLDEYRQAHPGRVARLAFLELMTPGLPEVLVELADAGCDDVVVHPLFLAAGAHTRDDLPRLVAEAVGARPALRVRVTEPLLESARLRAALIAAFRDDGPAAAGN